MLALIACGPRAGPADSDGTWVGTITHVGNVTTVVNESGSVWGDLEIRDAVTIGVQAGADPYMFGRIRSVAVDGQRVYVMDSQLSTVRVYDKTGAHLLDIGRQGDGPGELSDPWTMDVGWNGRIYVQDLRRLTAFAANGRFVETWPYRGGPSSGGGRELVVGNDGTVYAPSKWTEAINSRSDTWCCRPTVSKSDASRPSRRI